MPYKPNWVKWAAHGSLLDDWRRDAICRGRNDLPWTSNRRPDLDDLQRMGEICSTCPVLGKCAAHALHGEGGNGVAGGFWAGVWIPWREYGRGMDKDRDARKKARATIKSIIKKWKVLG